MTKKSWTGGAVATKLTADISAGATSITVDDASTYPQSTDPFVIAINRGSSTEEKVLIGSRSGNVLTATTRGYDGTSASAHTTNESVEHVLDAITVAEANSFVNLMTQRGDQVVYGSAGPARRAKGSSGQVWVMTDANDPGWRDPDVLQSETAWTPVITGSLVLGTGTGLLRTGGYSVRDGICTGWFTIMAGTTGFANGTIDTVALPVPLRSSLPSLALGNRLAVGTAMYGNTAAIPAVLSYYHDGLFFPYRTSDGSTAAPAAFTAAGNILSGFLQYPVD